MDNRAIVIEGADEFSEIISGMSIRDLAVKIAKQKNAAKNWKAERRDSKKVSAKTLAAVPASQQIEELASGEYFDKPYDQERLVELTEMNQRLKACISAMGTCCARLGLKIEPSRNRRRANLTGEEEKRYNEQSLDLTAWLNRIVDYDVRFEDEVATLVESKFAVGEGYLEVIEDIKGRVKKILFANPKNIWVRENPDDGYIQVYQGEKVYFKRFTDSRTMSAKTGNFDEPNKIPYNERATKLLHYRERNLISRHYGVPPWTAAIPAVLGSRYAEERNAAFFDNDAVPRMAVVVTGGALDEATIQTIRKFFKQGKGKEQFGRVLVMQASAKNANNPDAKAPVIKLEPLTVGKQDDQSFGFYLKDNKETIREAFRISSIFFGTSDDVNRAAAFTMREMTISQVFAPESQTLASFINNTLVLSWATEKGYAEVDSEGYVIKDEKLEVQVDFYLPETMSEKDKAEMYSNYASGGAMTPNDLRDIIGLPRIEASYANVPTPLAIVAMQMQLIQAPQVDVGELGEEYDATDAAMSTTLGNINRTLQKFMATYQTDPFDILGLRKRGAIEE